MIRQLHFTLGPVQGFVAQARRTRDFWAGSFILSWLSAVAMEAVRKQGGTIRFPEPDKNFMAALERGIEGPKQGNVPNRFAAEVFSEFRPTTVEEAVRTAWRELAEVVWTADVAKYANLRTRTIWKRQIESFWDVQWALVDDGEAADPVARLKNWRTHLPPDEHGVKCMMMDGWQELSGAEHPGRGLGDPNGPNEFWRRIRESGTHAMMTDLRDGEMLCAVAFVKRRFAHHFPNFSAAMPAGPKENGWTVRGWRLPSGVPSVHYMAAAPWLALLLGKTHADTESGQRVRALLIDFHRAAYELTGGYGEWETNVRCVRLADGRKEWKALDGAVYFDAMLENGNLWAERRDNARDVLGRLAALRREAGMGPASPFYAVLLMDGDELGIQMNEAPKQAAVAKGLVEFTGEVPRIVREHNGFLVYAGGDDVLAVLPLEDALRCAATLRSHYRSCFDRTDIHTSLSGAIEYAHVKVPLGKVLHDAHDLLVRVAKESRGRDAIACRVWRPGGMTVEWAMPWECALSGDDVVIDQLASSFREGMVDGEGDMTSKFFFRIRERFELLNPPKSGGDPVLDEGQALDLMAMEYLNSGLGREKGLDMAAARLKVQPLLAQCRPVCRDKIQKDATKWSRSKRLEADGAMLVRFLAHNGVER